MDIQTLLVEDDVMMAQTIAGLLRSFGHSVTIVHSGEDALDQLRLVPLDLVVSDIQLPGINGDEVMRKALAVVPHTPFILMTAHGAVQDAVRAIQDGAFQYLLKPIDTGEFEVVVHRALETTRMRRENEYLRSEMAGLGPGGDRLIGRSPPMMQIHDLIARVAPTDSTVLITGETGTGKEMLAQTLHYRSPRAQQPLIAFNCAAFNENLMESELFGHEKGAFTGAVGVRRGRFEDADGGTIFLDEIGETTKEFQAKLLRALQERQVERVGGNRPLDVDVRVLASTNRSLQAEVEAGRFREDLYYRLRVVPIHLPPLRERRDDILVLAQHFLDTFSGQYGTGTQGFSEAARDFLLTHPWQGNVRELKHTVERAVVLATGEVLEPADLTFPEESTPIRGAGPAADMALQDVLDETTREHVIRVLDATGWRKQKSAGILGIDRATLYRLVKKFSIERGS